MSERQYEQKAEDKEVERKAEKLLQAGGELDVYDESKKKWVRHFVRIRPEEMSLQLSLLQPSTADPWAGPVRSDESRCMHMLCRKVETAANDLLKAYVMLGRDVNEPLGDLPLFRLRYFASYAGSGVLACAPYIAWQLISSDASLWTLALQSLFMLATISLIVLTLMKFT